MESFSSQRKEATLLDVMSALSQVIQSQRAQGHIGDPTPTELFAVISLTLSSGAAVEHLPHVLKIFSFVTPQTASTILRAQFRPTAVTLMRIIQGCPDEVKVQSFALAALGDLMCAQEASEGFWSSVQALQCANALLAFIDDPRQPVRKAATSKLVQIMHVHQSAGCKGLRSYVGEFCLEITKGSMPGSIIAKLCSQSLQLQACGQPLLTAAVYRMLDSLFQSQSKSLSAATARQILRALVENRPETSDMEALTNHCGALASGIVRLKSLHPASAAEDLDDVTQALAYGCETEFTQIHCGVSNAFKRVISSCIDSNDIASAVAEKRVDIRSCTVPLNAFLNTVSTLLQLRYQSTWPYVLDVVQMLFETYRRETGSLLLGPPLLTKLVEIYEALLRGQIVCVPGTEALVFKSLSCALKSLGIQGFLSIVPLALPNTERHLGIDESREWMLSLLHNTLKTMRTDIADFGNTLFGIARQCSSAIKSAQKGEIDLTPAQEQKIKGRVVQMWELFPAFCTPEPADIPTSFPKLSGILNGAMQDEMYPEAKFSIISGLTNLAISVKEKYPNFNITDVTSLPPEVSALHGYSGTFIPQLLAIIEGMDVSDANFLTCTQCVSTWAALIDKSLIKNISKKLLQQILESTGSSEDSEINKRASVWMSVMLVLVPSIPQQVVTLLYKTIRPLLSVSESLSLQKRAYNVLDSLLVHHGLILFQTESKLDILGAISDSLLTCNVSARHMRLKCMHSLVTVMTDDGELTTAAGSIIGEILICQKDANKKSRDAACELLLAILRSVPQNAMFAMLCSALAGETAVMRSSAVLALCMLLVEHRGDINLITNAAALLPTISLLLREQCVEESRAILAYFKACVSTFSEEQLPQLSSIILPTMFVELGSLKGKFVSAIRSIVRKLVKRRVPLDLLRGFIPAEDLALLEYIERHDRRSTRKKEKSRQSRNMADKLLDSDSDDSDDDGGKASGGDGMVVEDYRLSARPKAVRAGAADLFHDDDEEDNGSEYGSVKDPEEAPTDDIASRRKVRVRAKGGAVSGGASMSTLEDDDDEFAITVSPSGQVVVERRALPEMHASASSIPGEPLASADQYPKQEMAGKKRGRLPGEEYRSKKAGGDVWRSGMLQPHAYIPLDAKLFSKKNHEEAMSQFGAVVNSRSAKDQKVRRSRHGQIIVPGNRKQREARKKSSGK